MVGFLFGSALGAALLAGWPIYLHLRRKRRMRVQSVPSLRLFGYTRKKTKRIRFQQLALLLTRVAFVIAIATLLAQPYIRISGYLPLPPVAGEKQDNLVLAVVIDDSLSSMHGLAGETRLDVSKATVRRVIDSMPSNSSVSVTLTSSPFPGPLMERKEALSYISELSPIPRPGEAVEALRHAVEAFAGRQVCLLVSAPRSDDLWYAVKKPFVHAEDLKVFFHDLDAVRTHAIITRVDGEVVNFRGKPGDLQGVQLVVTPTNREAFSRTLTAHEALIGEAALPTIDADRPMTLSIGSGNHPWQTYFHRPGSTKRAQKHVVILRQQDASGLAADKIISGVLISSGQAVSIDHLDPAEETLPENADAVVAVDGLNTLPKVAHWLDDGGGKTATLLACPPSAANANWLPAIDTASDQSPTTILDPQGLPIDALGLLDLRSLQPKRLTEPTIGSAALALADEAVLFSKEMRNGGGVTWRMGFRIHTGEEAVFHPAFPLLLSSILIPATTDTDAANATVGQVVRADTWFGSDQLSGSIVLPEGDVVQVPPGSANATFVKINQPGIYRFDSAGDSRYRVANVPRPTSDASLSLEEVSDRLGNPALTVTTPNPRVTAEDFHYLDATSSTHVAARKRRDLSPIAFALALAFLCIEAVLLHIVWRRRAVISE